MSEDREHILSADCWCNPKVEYVSARQTYEPTGQCKHCGRAIYGYAHIADGGHLTKGRCDPDESGLPYGYNAEPLGAPCENPCIGAIVHPLDEYRGQ